MSLVREPTGQVTVSGTTYSSDFPVTPGAYDTFHNGGAVAFVARFDPNRFRALLGGAQTAYRDAVLLNSAAALVVAGKAADLREGVAQARESIDSGAAKAKITALAEATQKAA